MSSGLGADVDVSAVELRRRVPSAGSEDMKVMPASNVNALAQAKKDDSQGSFDGKVRPKGEEKKPEAGKGSVSGQSGGTEGKDSTLAPTTREGKASDDDVKIATFDPKEDTQAKTRKSLIDPSMDRNQLGPKKVRRGSNVSLATRDSPPRESCVGR